MVTYLLTSQSDVNKEPGSEQLYKTVDNHPS